MEWRKVTDYPERRADVVLLYNNGNAIEFNAEFDGEDYCVLDDEAGIWSSWSVDIMEIVGWIYLSEVEEYLRGLKFKED